MRGWFNDGEWVLGTYKIADCAQQQHKTPDLKSAKVSPTLCWVRSDKEKEKVHYILDYE